MVVKSEVGKHFPVSGNFFRELKIEGKKISRMLEEYLNVCRMKQDRGLKMNFKKKKVDIPTT